MPETQGLAIALAASGILLLGFSVPAPAEEGQDIGVALLKMVEPKDANKDLYVIKNMHKLQQAAESYASAHGGKYPTAVDNAFKSFLPLGLRDDKTSMPFSKFFNPYTQARDWPILGKVTNLREARRAAPNSISPGAIEYSPIGKGSDYAIRGGGGNGKAVAGSLEKKPDRTLVFSRDDLEAIFANARIVEFAAESYAEDHQYHYPRTMDQDFRCYFPGGDPAVHKEGRPLMNPFTKKNSWPISGKLTDLSAVRHSAPGPLAAGELEYSATADGSNYLIRCGGKNNKALTGYGGQHSTMVLAKDGDGTGLLREMGR